MNSTLLATPQKQRTQVRAYPFFTGVFGWPIELRLAAFLVVLWVVGLWCGLPVNWPDASSLEFIHRHYFSPLLIALGLQVAVFWFAGRRRLADPLIMLKLLPFLALVVLVHFNLKAWMPLVNPCSFDEYYHQTDQLFWPVVALFRDVRQAIAELSPWNDDDAYHGAFVAMFFISVSVHALKSSTIQQRQLILGLSLVLILGGLCYWIAPAIGPFIFEPGVNPESTGVQHHMLGMFRGVCQQGQFPPGYFTAPLAAMPSLHVAHALFFTLFAYSRVRWLFWVYVPLLFWIVLESVASCWHYLIDLPVGAVLAVYCLNLAQRLLPEVDQGTGSKPAVTSIPSVR